jgi:hypothetical protein
MKRDTKVGLSIIAGGLVLHAIAHRSAPKTAAPDAPRWPALLSALGYGAIIGGAATIAPKYGLATAGGLLGIGYVNRARQQAGKAPLPLPGFFVELGVKHPGGLDSNLDPETAGLVLTALGKENDPQVLIAFAAKLEAAGHPLAADKLRARARSLTPVAIVGAAPNVVQAAQIMLHDLGWDLQADGVLGPQTKRAIEEFQSLYDLDIDGVLGPATIAALRAATTAHP